MTLTLMRNKAKYQPVIVLPILSLLSDASDDAIYAGKRYLNKSLKLSGDTIQILQSSPDVQGAQKISWKGSKERRTFVSSRSSSGTSYPVLCNESTSFPWSKAKPLSWAPDGSEVAHIHVRAHLAPRCWPSCVRESLGRHSSSSRSRPETHGALCRYCLDHLSVASSPRSGLDKLGKDTSPSWSLVPTEHPSGPRHSKPSNGAERTTVGM